MLKYRCIKSDPHVGCKITIEILRQNLQNNIKIIECDCDKNICNMEIFDNNYKIQEEIYHDDESVFFNRK